MTKYVTKIDVRGKEAKIYLYDLDAWSKLCVKEGSPFMEAYFSTSSFSLHFCTAYLNQENITHELAHSYIYTGYPDVLNLSVEQVEELACEIFANHGSRILTQANTILTKLEERKTKYEKNTKKKRLNKKLNY